ncbi:hypothetical protein A6A08_02540 [Nocardiopsis sp. TSRI0078]|uniref:hypothetical protein n=1 Tax=unclassified Nocardiopsis TaxID=2649073 RepID=UPI00093A92D1|nr:hypothetical protein [Nocardiopsis sp. TSRI0078]OKI23665.1 hypothetical protein A6A08_02540 [Nocardiopsis sp. TSRI0078]
MADESDSPGGPPAPDQDQGGRLARRLGLASSVQQVEEQREQERQQEQRGEDPAPRRSTAGRRRVLLVRIGYWSATGLVTLGALVLFAMAGSINAHHQAGLEEQAQDGFDAQERVTAAEQGLEDLPSQTEAGRWLARATTVGEDLAEAQNTYLDHTGPITTDDLPEQTPGPGGRDECHPYLDDPPTTTRDYTEEELTACAEGLRQSAIGGLERALTPHFTASARDSDGFNAVSQWHSAIPTLDDDAPLSGYTWTAHEAQAFEQDLAIRMVWILTEDETGRTVAWLSGRFDPLVSKFDDMVLGTVADEGEEAAEGGEAAEDGADEDSANDGDTAAGDGADEQGDEPEDGE